MEKRGLANALIPAVLRDVSGLGFSDELRLGLRGLVRRVWAPRGVKIVQPVELRFEWRSLVLAVDGPGGTLRWAWSASMKSAALAPVLSAWKDAGVPGLVWDGAASHRGRAVRAVGLPTVIQPAASPERNPAERSFEEVRRAGEGRPYAALADNQQAVERFLAALAATPSRVRSLAGWAWIAAALQPATENRASS